MDKLATNMKAAKLCGVECSEYNGNARYEGNDIGCGQYVSMHFDIFTNPADREATVIALGEKYLTDICFIKSCGWYWTDADGDTGDFYRTYREALAAAVGACDE